MDQITGWPQAFTAVGVAACIAAVLIAFVIIFRGML